MEASPDLDQRIAAIAVLDQPIRRDLYALLTERDDWTTRDVAAEALGVTRSTAAFHLDKLADAGVVEVSYERTTGRTGPGAGRPSKRYRPASDELAASVPQRHYDLAGSLLAGAVSESMRTNKPVDQCLRAVACSAGQAIGAGARLTSTSDPSDPSSTSDPSSPSDPSDPSSPSDPAAPATEGEPLATLVDVLARNGYEPEQHDGEIALRNCPFHRLAEQHRALVCGMNLDLLTGLVEGLDAAPDLDARLAPEPGYCCVRLTPHAKEQRSRS